MLETPTTGQSAFPLIPGHFTIADAAAMAHVTPARVGQILKKHNIRHLCQQIGSGQKAHLLLIPDAYRHLFTVSDLNITRRESGRSGGRAATMRKQKEIS